MNKRLIGTIAAGIATSALLLAAPMASARDHVNWSINVGLPGVAAYPAYSAYPAYPVYSQPQVVYQQPQPVYVQPAPVYYPAPRVYVAPAPVYYTGYYGPHRYWDHGRYGYRHGGYYGR